MAEAQDTTAEKPRPTGADQVPSQVSTLLPSSVTAQKEAVGQLIERRPCPGSIVTGADQVLPLYWVTLPAVSPNMQKVDVGQERPAVETSDAGVGPDQDVPSKR